MRYCNLGYKIILTLYRDFGLKPNAVKMVPLRLQEEEEEEFENMGYIGGEDGDRDDSEEMMIGMTGLLWILDSSVFFRFRKVHKKDLNVY